MKKGNAIITLNNPCHEDWDSMSATDKGRYCAACQKTVIDFTLMTDGQILDIFKKAGSNSPCGNFLNTQLDRPLIDTRYKTSVGAVLAKRVAAVFLLLQSATTALAQQAKKQVPATQSVNKNNVAKNQLRQIKGKVVDITTHIPQAGVQVSISGTNSSTVSDINGLFSLDVPPEWHEKTLTLIGVPASEHQSVDSIVIDLTNYDGHEILMYGHQQTRHATAVSDLVTIQPGIYQKRGSYNTNTDGGRNSGNLYIIDGVEVPKAKPTLWQRITKPFRKKHHADEAK